MATTVKRTPGVYVEELEAFPPSIVSVQTAVPAFIGYTEFARINGKPVFYKPVKISSLVDYTEIFGYGYEPQFTIEPAPGSPEGKDDFDFSAFDTNASPPAEKFYELSDSTAGFKIFNLYNSLRLFFDNGGGTCWVVSVGNYEVDSIEADDLIKGLGAIEEQVGPTMLVVPDAVLLDPDDTQTPWQSSEFERVTKTMLAQAGELQDRVAILDVYGSQYADKNNLETIVEQFQADVGGPENLSYGMAYFPFLQSTVVPASELDYSNIYIGDCNSSGDGELQKVLIMENDFLYPVTNASPADATTLINQQVLADILKISPDNTEAEIRTLDQNLTASLPVLNDMEKVIRTKLNLLPPSGGMAGIYTQIDNSRGVWNAPANVSMASVEAPSFLVNNEQQGDLNVPVNGKAIDVLREFPSRGTVVWGARTLDGNSNDYRYVQVRRTLIYVEQSIKNALDAFVFAANDGNTWATVVSMISGFLQGLWSQGGLMGATANEAYSVECGLGSTMTAQDILDGYMYVQVTLQMVRPAEFIVLTFTQKMEG